MSLQTKILSFFTVLIIFFSFIIVGVQTSQIVTLNLGGNVSFDVGPYTVTIYYDNNAGSNARGAFLAVNDEQEFTKIELYSGYEDLGNQEGKLIIENVERIAFGCYNSELTRVFDTGMLTVTSNTGIDDSLYDGRTPNTDFLGWYEITQDTTFNLVFNLA